MGAFSIWHWLIVLAVVLLLFGGGGKITRLMGDFGKGLKSFKKGIKEEGEEGKEGEDAPQLKSEETSSVDTPAKDKSAQD